MKCGRQPDGEKVDELGICPTTMSSEYDGTHRGVFGGRFCWAVTATFCGGKIRGTFANKLESCIDCEFLKQVNEDEGRDFILSPK